MGNRVSGVRAEATGVAVAPTPCRVALIGDSLTDFRVGGGGFVRYLEKKSPRSTFTNYAKGGAMVNQMRRHFESVVLAEPPGRFTHVIVFGGVNDLYSDETAGRTPAKIEADLSFMIAASKQRGWRVVALTVAPWGGFTRYFNERRSATTRELNAWILEQARNGTVDGVVDAFSLLSCGDPERLCPEYEPPFKDGLHFGKGGHDRLGQALYESAFRSCS
jgi:lysophospholipase L1-like esterase